MKLRRSWLGLWFVSEPFYQAACPVGWLHIEVVCEVAQEPADGPFICIFSLRNNMYIPKPFEVTDRDEIIAFIGANAFGQLVSTVRGRLFSTHLPFLVSPDRTQLICHLAKPNPQWESIDKQEVLVTLQGPHDYISPSWYSSPGVPTWNYQAVHIYGNCKTFHAPEKLKHIVDAFTKTFESSFEQPWQPAYNESLLQGIVGVEVEITEIQCKYKLSQNRSKEDQIQVTKQLEAKESDKLAQAMRKNV